MTRLNAYISDVTSNPSAYPKTVQASVKRHLRDLEKKDFDFYFDPTGPVKIIKFLEILVQSTDRFAGKGLKLQGFQVFFLAMLYGWKRKGTGERRFQVAYLGIPRKNGKSTFLSGIALFEMLASQSPEVYLASNDRSQASLMLTMAKDFIKNTDGFLDYFDLKHNKIIKKAGGSLLPLHAESERLAGLNPSVVLYDEIHDSKNSDLYSVLRTAQASRSNPLMLMIGSHSPHMTWSYEFEKDMKSVSEGTLESDTVFSLIYEPDEHDDLNSPTTWEKVNPNWGVSINPDGFKAIYEESLRNSQTRNSFYIYNLNAPIQGTSSKWLDLEKVKAQMTLKPEQEDFSSLPVFVGFDLSSYHDLTAFAYAIPTDDGPKLFFRTFIPEDTFNERVKLENPLFGDWVEKGFVTLIPGSVIDEDFLLEDLKDTLERHNLSSVQEIAFDPWGSRSLIKKMEDRGFETVEFRQGLVHFSPYVKQFEKAILEGSLLIEENPVFLWCMGNAELQSDTNGNYKPKKGKERKRIDLVIAGIQAYGRLVSHYGQEGKLSTKVQSTKPIPRIITL